MKTRPELLLHPNIPKPMHGVAPRIIMGDSWWNEQKKLCKQKTAYHCLACGVSDREAKFHQWLEAHEFFEIDYEKGRMIFKEVVPLCHSCHNFIHSGRLKVLVGKGEISPAKQKDILKHGRAILIAAGLSTVTAEVKGFAAWPDWRMVFNGKEYPPLYKSYDEWLDKFNPGWRAFSDFSEFDLEFDN